LIPDLFNKEIFEFIKANESSDPFELSLRAKEFSGDIIRLMSNQIRSRQKLRKKIPEWLGYDHIILPAPASIEQASSDITGKYKSELIQGGTLLDLTGGLGVDTYFFAKRSDKVIYIEKDPEIAAIAAYNFSMMGLDNVEVKNQSAEIFIQECNDDFDYIYLDPSRRKMSNKVFKLEDSEPDLLSIQDELLLRSKVVITKAAPYIDLQYALERIKKLKEIHVLSVDNECKEIILISNHSNHAKDPKIIAVNYKDNTFQEYSSTIFEEQNTMCEQALRGTYIYDPNTAIRKAGLFRSICKDFGLKKPANNSHIYFSDTFIEDFPGRIFKMMEAIPYQKFMKRQLFQKANIAIRNFPLSVDKIRKKTGISDGGDIFIFATTDHNKIAFFIICRKIGKI
jgi:16S rRNA G966 N2-methylase RsmD